MKLLATILIFLIVGYSSCEAIQLFSASIDKSATSSTLRGSLRGGTTIYIYGLGFPRDPRELQIWVGSNECIIPNNGITSTVISCETTDSNSNNDISSLEIQVVSGGQIFTVPSASFTYREADTPIISDVFPSVSTPSNLVNLYGRHRVNDYGDGERDTGDFQGVFIGDNLCSLFDIEQEVITYNNINRLQCRQSSTQAAGKVNVSTHVTAGWSDKTHYVRKASLNDEYYEFTILPEITNIYPKQGYISGQKMNIYGSGFPSNVEDLEISVGGVPCLPNMTNSNHIFCIVQ